MQEFTFIITGKNMADGYITVDYIPSDATLSNRSINLYIPSDSIESGNLEIIRDAIRHDIIVSSPQGQWADEKYRLTTTLPTDLDTFIGRTDLPPVLLSELNTVIVPVDFTDMPGGFGQTVAPGNQPPRALIKLAQDGRAKLMVGDATSANDVDYLLFHWHKIISKLTGQDYWVRFTSDVSPYTGSTGVWHHLNTDQIIGWRDDGDPSAEGYTSVTATVTLEIAQDSAGTAVVATHNITVNVGYI